jgi:plastocyanin
MKLIATLAAAGAVGLLATTSASPMAPVKLTGTVGPGFTITLTHLGKKVTLLKPGAYTFVVADRSSIHNFHLTGPGVNKAITQVLDTGTKTVTLTLKKGTYTYKCDVHPTTMIGHFKVG